MRTVPQPPGKAMYVAAQLDESWLRTEQRKLYTRSSNNPAYVFCKLWGLLTDPRNLRMAFARVARNKGRRTAGVDGVTVGHVLRDGVDAFLANVRTDLRSGAYRPSPTRRVRIPKPGQPGKSRPLGIPTVKDRIVQAAMKNILEPIFEADFFPVSYGFRPGKSVHGAIEHLKHLLRPRKADRSAYQYAIEGDIKGCFDNIDHHEVMNRVRRRLGDGKMARLVGAFLKAGVLEDGQFLRTDVGTPQGGILSPLLANIALAAIEERYQRHVWPRHTPTLRTEPKRIEARAKGNRQTDRKLGRVVLYPIRYADDFIVLVGVASGPDQDERAGKIAHEEKDALVTHLQERLRLELSEAKTLVTPVTRPLRFLGHHVSVHRHPSKRRMVSRAVIPKDRSHHLRERIKHLFRRDTLRADLASRLRVLNPLLRGWSSFYRHAWGAKRVFNAIDHYVWWTILRWLRKKHERVHVKTLWSRYGWRKPSGRMLRWKDGDVTPFEMASVRVGRFRLAWQHPPHFAQSSMESPVQNERCTPGSEGGAQKPTGASRRRR
jgi:RNA-directed DNA polymerase